MVVPALHFAELLAVLARHRRSTPGTTLLKLDVEGAEYEILDDAARQSLLCESILTAISVEWHDKQWPDIVWPQPWLRASATAKRNSSQSGEVSQLKDYCGTSTSDSRLGCRIRMSNRNHRTEAIKKLLGSSTSCNPTRFIDNDDERYHYDGVPFPPASWTPRRTFKEYFAEQMALRQREAASLSKQPSASKADRRQRIGP